MKPFNRFGVNICKSDLWEGSVYAVACTFALIEKVISVILRPYDLTPAKFNAMMIIKHKGKDKGISQIEVGRHLIVTASNMTRLMDKLDAEGFIERLDLKGDRRVNLVRISQKGSELLDRIWPSYNKKIKEISRLLSKTELAEITKILEKWSSEIFRSEFLKRH